jgi:hypothetical protein
VADGRVRTVLASETEVALQLTTSKTPHITIHKNEMQVKSL